VDTAVVIKTCGFVETKRKRSLSLDVVDTYQSATPPCHHYYIYSDNILLRNKGRGVFSGFQNASKTIPHIGIDFPLK
jgi:hypothetical protein